VGPPPGAPLGEPGAITVEELQLAARNHGMPLEALRWPVTPVGLHYLLIHYDIPEVDPGTWRLDVGGVVDRPASLTLDDLRALPSTTVTATMECAGNGRARFEPRPLSQPWLHEAVGTATWTGVPLPRLLEHVGIADDAAEVVFTGLDRGLGNDLEQSYARALPQEEAAERDEVLLAYEMNGGPLPPQHGFPLRLVTPGWYGMTNVKWLTRIEVVAEPFRGYQNELAYRWKTDPDEPGTPLTRMEPRSLMLPPGIPDFFTRRRLLPTGPCDLTGRAWSGRAPIDAVWVSTDGGASWDEAEVEPPHLGRWAWQGWRYLWTDPAPGVHEVCCRARDAGGNEQPVEALWNLGGYTNNAPHRVTVDVRPPAPARP
jgi:DMSO/TMAO reductase YedYZ molybdopterin-dependent catalytic subunit